MCIYDYLSLSKVDADSPCVRTYAYKLTHTRERVTRNTFFFGPSFFAGKLKKMARQMGSNNSPSRKGGDASLGSAKKKRPTTGSRRPPSRTSMPLSANGHSPLLLYCVCE